jgi:uncharacterized protein YdhG (YjbR/CyaY superfamily)
VSVIDDYIHQFDPPVQKELERIRAIAKRLIPDPKEVISYGMPAIKYRGQAIIGFDSHANHIGIYPFSGHVISKIEELKNYSTTKGAIQEELDQLLPDSLIEKVIKERIKQAVGKL